jgi:hypothetical protein
MGARRRANWEERWLKERDGRAAIRPADDFDHQQEYKVTPVMPPRKIHRFGTDVQTMRHQFLGHHNAVTDP